MPDGGRTACRRRNVTAEEQEYLRRLRPESRALRPPCRAKWAILPQRTPSGTFAPLFELLPGSPSAEFVLRVAVGGVFSAVARDV